MAKGFDTVQSKLQERNSYYGRFTGHFRLFSAIFGYFRLFLVIFGHFRLFFDGSSFMLWIKKSITLHDYALTAKLKKSFV